VNRRIVTLLCAATLWPAAAQKLKPVQWSFAEEPAEAPAGARVLGRVTAKLDSGWHLYALAAPKPIIATSIKLAANPAVESV
jgi:hypothetical protein